MVTGVSYHTHSSSTSTASRAGLSLASSLAATFAASHTLDTAWAERGFGCRFEFSEIYSCTQHGTIR